VAATTVSGAVYGFAGTPYQNSQHGGVHAFYFPTPTTTAGATATPTAAAASPLYYAGMYSVMMSGYQFGATAGNNGGSSDPNYFATVTIGATGAITMSTPIEAAYTSI